MSNGNNDDDDRKDLTRIEDLSEFLHQDDEETESKFDIFNTEPEGVTSTGVTTGLNLDDLSDADLPPELPESLEAAPEFTAAEEPEAAESTVSEMNFGDTSESGGFESNEEISFGQEATTEIEAFDDQPFTLSEEPQQDEEIQQEEIPEEIVQEETPEEIHESYSVPENSQERFEEVKNFAQNFSYGQIQGGGNPPFSIIVRNLKYENDAEDIITILREFGLVTDQNQEETEKALQMGSLLIPQISEYSAIVLAHKIRRYDCDIEVGLSDEVHPSKSGETNPRGLLRKDSLKQNITESYHRDEEETPVKEILVSTLAALPGFNVKKYIGVQTSFAIIDEDELERLKFVQKTTRINAELHDYQTDESVTSERAFKDYQKSFDLLFVDLCDQLKVKAMKEKANALLGLNYQLTSLPFEKTHQGSSCFQLTCSATLAVVAAEV